MTCHRNPPPTYHNRASQSVSAGIRASVFQLLELCYCENSGSPAGACVLRRHYSITYTQSLHAINGLILWDEWGTYFVDACRKFYPT